MKKYPLFLSACPFVSLGCDIDNIGGLDTEMLTVSVTTAGANVDADGYLLAITAEPVEPIGVKRVEELHRVGSHTDH